MYAYLVMVKAGENNNKYYEMKDNEDGTFTANYGRVGYNPQRKIWPTRRWDSIYNSKLKKGYTDVTHTRAKTVSTEAKTSTKIKTDSQIVKDIFEFLLQSTKTKVHDNYTVPVNGVTQAMVDDAQDILNTLVSHSDKHDWTAFNDSLQKLFVVIPRRMSNVRDYLLHTDDINTALKMIQSEQDTLDSLKGQIVVDENDDTQEQQISLFTTMGIEVYDTDDMTNSIIKKELTDISHMFHSAVRVTNLKTKKRFDDYVSRSDNKETRLLWHGSRHENWISLMQKGLMLYPTNAVITGKMFGYGLYFAPRAKKSLGYTSYHNSYWANGRSNRAYMSLFRVHTGKMKVYDSAQSSLKYNDVKAMGYDSVKGAKGRYLVNDEIIVYNENQTDIQYLVELR